MGLEKVSPKQCPRDLGDGDGPLKMSIVAFEWDGALSISADVATIGSS